MSSLTDYDLQELASERRADAVAVDRAGEAKSKRQTAAEARRRGVALECARRLEASCNALRAFMRACNDCNDASATLESQGKGIDGRTKLVAEMAEYSAYLLSVYEGQA